MKIHEMKGKRGKARKRVGRGIGSGTGKTAGKGTKGQKARTGHHKVPAAFEGGQMPIHMRLPKKRGFKRNPNVRKITLTLLQLDRTYADGAVVDEESLIEKGLISAGQTPKIIGGTALNKKLEVKIALSAGAAAAITNAGGSAGGSKKR